MSNLTSELNLKQAVDNDDTEVYLTQDLANSLGILDGLFNQGSGHAHNGAHQGGAIGANAIGTVQLQDLSVTTSKIAPGAVTGAKLAADVLESIYANTTIHQTANYTVVAASPIMWVYCDAAITVTLTAALNRPVTVWAITGNSTVVSTSGSVIGGSINTTTGAVTNGGVSQGDGITYKWDGANWRAT